MPELKIIQGDTANITFTIEKGADLIEELYFSSKGLGISQKLTKINDTQYLASFDTDITCNCKNGYTTYDITAILKDNQVSTLVYSGELRVLKKENAINGN